MKLTQTDAPFQIKVSTAYHGVPEPTAFTKEDLELCRIASGKVDEQERCPVFHDLIPWKSWTVIVPLEHEQDAMYWLDYIHGADSVTWRKQVDHRSVALRSNYMAW